MTRSEYWDQVDSTLNDAWEEFVEHVKSQDQPDDVRYPDDAFREILDQHIDSDLPDCDDVMTHTQNEDYVIDNMGEVSGKTWRDVQREFCYWAYYGDVYERMSVNPDEYVREQQEEWDEAHEEEEEDEDESTPPPAPSGRQPTAPPSHRNFFFPPLPPPPSGDPVDIFRMPRKSDDDGTEGFGTFPFPELSIPTFYGEEKRRELTRRWGLPNVYPRPGESPFGHCRVLFRDDDRSGEPVAFWAPGKPPSSSLLGLPSWAKRRR